MGQCDRPVSDQGPALVRTKSVLRVELAPRSGGGLTTDYPDEISEQRISIRDDPWLKLQLHSRLKWIHAAGVAVQRPFGRTAWVLVCFV